MRMRSLVHLLIALLITAPFAAPFKVAARRKTPMPKGQNAHSSNWEERFRSLLRTENLRATMKRLSAEPHHLGSRADKQNAEWMRDQFKAWGWNATLEEYDVLFLTPREWVVELTAPTKYVAQLKELKAMATHIDEATRLLQK